jgi:hypothetical protein
MTEARNVRNGSNSDIGRSAQPDAALAILRSMWKSASSTRVSGSQQPASTATLSIAGAYLLSPAMAAAATLVGQLADARSS